MAQEQRPPRRPSPPGLPPQWEKDLTQKFKQTLSTKRMNKLSSRIQSPSPSASPSRSSNEPSSSQLPSRHGQSSHAPRAALPLDDFALGAPPPASTGIQNIPVMPREPTETAHIRFRNQLLILSETPRFWENPGLLDEALGSVPLEAIYREADDALQLARGIAESVGKKVAWGWQDYVVRALLKWFKNTFFKWVNNPPCRLCHSPTVASADGYAAPTPEEKALGGNKVELYKCASSRCGAHERFPRYNDAFVLLRTRKGRVGEWANCFGMLCRAIGSRVRWVWSSEDYVWTEIYSEHRNRWVHVDPVEGEFDRPLLYTNDFHRKLRYCIAFSADGAQDVTRRYCRNPSKSALERNRVPEDVLLHILDEIRTVRRSNKSKEERFALEGEDMRESRELRYYFVSTLTHEVANLVVPGTKTLSALDADALKALELAAERSRERGEDGNTNPNDRHDRHDQQPPR